jgi:crotonobetainyl-CoA:carnitine CoA-transferase CaiB-like acyl-CoA transferase
MMIVRRATQSRSSLLEPPLRYPRAGSPLSFGAAPRVPAKPAPLMGADTRAVLSSWLHLADAELDALATEGVIPPRPAPG